MIVEGERQFWEIVETVANNACNDEFDTRLVKLLIHLDKHEKKLKRL